MQQEELHEGCSKISIIAAILGTRCAQLATTLSDYKACTIRLTTKKKNKLVELLNKLIRLRSEVYFRILLLTLLKIVMTIVCGEISTPRLEGTNIFSFGSSLSFVFVTSITHHALLFSQNLLLSLFIRRLFLSEVHSVDTRHYRVLLCTVEYPR